MGRLTAAAAAVLTVATLTLAPALVHASPSPRAGCRSGYEYGGYATREGVHGVVATVSASEQPRVATGHAAAWVGVGGVHVGRGGESEWLQAGIAAFPETGLRLYVEAVSPGTKRRFVDLGPAQRGRRYRVGVTEVAANVWQAAVAGRAVGTPVYLPPARGAWRGIATSESWRTAAAPCNRYAFRFANVSVRGTTWTALGAAERVGRGVTRSGAAFAATA